MEQPPDYIEIIVLLDGVKYGLRFELCDIPRMNDQGLKQLARSAQRLLIDNGRSAAMGTAA